MTQKTKENPWTLDVRVRERNLRAGSLTEKDLEKFLAQLPDLAAESEPFGIPQPALTDSHHAVAVHHHAVVATGAGAVESDADIDDDEDEEDDDAADDSESEVSPASDDAGGDGEGTP